MALPLRPTSQTKRYDIWPLVFSAPKHGNLLSVQRNLAKKQNSAVSMKNKILALHFLLDCRKTPVSLENIKKPFEYVLRMHVLLQYTLTTSPVLTVAVRLVGTWCEIVLRSNIFLPMNILLINVFSVLACKSRFPSFEALTVSVDDGALQSLDFWIKNTGSSNKSQWFAFKTADIVVINFHAYRIHFIRHCNPYIIPFLSLINIHNACVGNDSPGTMFPPQFTDRKCTWTFSAKISTVSNGCLKGWAGGAQM